MTLCGAGQLAVCVCVCVCVAPGISTQSTHMVSEDDRHSSACYISTACLMHSWSLTSILCSLTWKRLLHSLFMEHNVDCGWEHFKNVNSF